jgi:isopenicillin N synthase-like dioxygenase
MNPSTLTNLCLSLMLCIALSMPISAQQLFMIHEDVVRVDKMMQYEEASMTLQKYIGAHGDGLTYNAATTNDMHYLYIIPIENHGALDELDKKFAALGEKVGMEKLGALFN